MISAFRKAVVVSVNAFWKFISWFFKIIETFVINNCKDLWVIQQSAVNQIASLELLVTWQALNSPSIVSCQLPNSSLKGACEDHSIHNEASFGLMWSRGCKLFNLPLFEAFFRFVSDPDVPLSSLQCDFESDNFCLYKNSLSDDFDWTLNKGATQSPETGPDADHTTRNCESIDQAI